MTAKKSAAKKAPAKRAPRPAPVIVPAAVAFGDRSDAVRDLQVMLRDFGYPMPEVNGVFENYTRNAVAMFQEANGIPMTGHWREDSVERTGVLVAQDSVVPFTQ